MESQLLERMEVEFRVQGQLGEKVSVRSYLKNKLKGKGLGTCFKW
jgi:hypothetical protein